MDLNSLQSTFGKYFESDKVKFIAIFLVTIIIASSTIVVLTYEPETPEKPEPPEYDNASYQTNFNYDSINFQYTYIGPDNPPEEVVTEDSDSDSSNEEIVPIRAIIHTSDKITTDTILHEFDPHSKKTQSYDVDLKELAEDPDDHLRTHPEINYTIVHSNGSMETVRTIDPENIGDVLFVQVNPSPSDPEDLTLHLSSIKGQEAIIKTPNTEYTIERGSTDTKRIISPEDYYVDEDDDGIYETRGSVEVYIKYHEIEKEVTSFNPSYTAPHVSVSDGPEEGHMKVSVNRPTEPIALYTPGGEYIVNEYLDPTDNEIKGDGSYVQLMEGLGDEDKAAIATVDDDASEIKILVERNGSLYVAETIDVSSD